MTNADYQAMSDYDLIIRFGRCECGAARLPEPTTQEDGTATMTFTCRNGHEQ